MTQPASQPDGSAPLSRRDLLRLGVTSLGVPLLAASMTPLAAADRPAQVDAEATPATDFPRWEGESYRHDRRGGRSRPLDQAGGPALRREEAVAETRGPIRGWVLCRFRRRLAPVPQQEGRPRGAPCPHQARQWLAQRLRLAGAMA